MKLRVFLTLILVYILIPLNSFSIDYSPLLAKWLKILKSGTDQEKILALDSIWVLKYSEYRKDISRFDPILDALKDESVPVREAAADYLEYFGDATNGCCRDMLLPPLIEALYDNNPRVKAKAAAALANYQDSRAIKHLIKTLKDKDPWVRLNAVYSLGELMAKEAIDPVLELLNDDSDWRSKFVQQECIITLRKLKASDKRVISLLIQKYNDDYLKLEIIRTLGAFRAFEAEGIFLEALQSSDKKTRKFASEAILQLPFEQTNKTERSRRLKLFMSLMKDSSEDVKLNAVKALARLRDERAIDPLIKALQDKSGKVKASAILALENFNDIRILDPLIDLFSYKGQSQAAEVFLSIAERTFEKRVNIYIEDNSKPISKYFGVIRKGSIQRMIHPVAVDKLINAINTSNPRAKLKILQIIHKFEDERIEPALIMLLSDSSHLVRRRATDILSYYGTIKSLPALIISLEDQDEHVRASAVKALGEVQNIRALIIEKLNDNNENVRKSEVNALRLFDDLGVLDVNIKLLKDKTSAVKIAAIQNIQKSPDIRAVEPLILLLIDSDWVIASNAAVALGIIKDKRAVEPLITVLNNVLDNMNKKERSNATLTIVSIEALGRLGDKKAIPVLKKALNDKKLVIAAIDALGLIKDEQAVSILRELVSDKRSFINQKALSALAEIGYPSALDDLEAHLKNNQFGPNYSVIKAIGKINGDKAVAILVDLLNSSNRMTDITVITVLAGMKNKKAVRQLAKIAGKNKYRYSVIASFKRYENPELIDILIGYLKDTDKDVKTGAILLLGEFKDKRAIEPLKALTEESDIIIRDYSKYSIKKIKASQADKLGTSKTRQLSSRPSSGYESGREYSGSSVGFKEKYDGLTTTKLSKTEINTKKHTEYVSLPKSRDIKYLIPKLNNSNTKFIREAADKLGDSGNKEAVKYLIPLLKAKDEYVRQAAARALGKLKDKKAVMPLIEVLKDKDDYVRAYSAWALGEIIDKRAIEPLIHSLQKENSLKAKEKKMAALKMFKEDHAARNLIAVIFMNGLTNKNYSQTANLLPVFNEDKMLRGFEDAQGDDVKTIENYVMLLESDVYGVNKLGINGLKESQNRKLVIKELTDLVKSEEKEHDKIISLLSQLRDVQSLPVFVYILENRNKYSNSAKSYAIKSIVDLKYKDASTLLLNILNDSGEKYAIRENSARNIGKLGDKNAERHLIDIVNNKKEHKNVRLGAAVALNNIGGAEAVEPLIKVLKDDQEDIWLRVSAASALGNIGDEMAIKPLQETTADPSSYVRNAAITALRKLKK